MTAADVAGLIARLPAFADLDDAERAAVAAIARVEQVPAGTTLFRESDPADNLRFILEGRILLGMRFGGRGEVIVLSLGPGELLGWTALLGGTWTATARAATHSTLVSLPGAEVSDEVEGPAAYLICGPEIMMRFTVQALAAAGVPTERMFLSMERHMKCAAGFCGRCQYGPFFVCKDGPIFRYDQLALLFGKEGF